MRRIDRYSAVSFLAQFREARLAALADAEAFESIIHTVERVGCYLNERIGDLGKYRAALNDLAQLSWLARPGSEFRSFLTPFSDLYELVRIARNDALHQGASARHLTRHAVELAIVLEDALSTQLNPTITDFMVRNPTCAELWQPISFVRQQMLANSYSSLPVFADDGSWRVVSDAAVARFLGAERNVSRKSQLAKTLLEASREDRELLQEVPVLSPDTSIYDVLATLKGQSVVLVKDEVNRDSAGRIPLLGILTAFDLL